MNLTQTKRWQEFENWYKQAYPHIPFMHNSYQLSFLALPFEFQEGVYRKFIMQYAQIGSAYSIDDTASYWISYKGRITDYYKSFQELVTWFFNN